ncbi:unnamed protein product [Callosobruchus maculatus]|uniref:Uncharacterized protein n=1 Tax=Callosobruchus maculatus TaxID=64391 RepID=A0A653DFP5_CALMS|nr:unnamed protein product [Callosobruchus maculatus]
MLSKCFLPKSGRFFTRLFGISSGPGEELLLSARVHIFEDRCCTYLWSSRLCLVDYLQLLEGSSWSAFWRSVGALSNLETCFYLLSTIESGLFGILS